MAEEFYQLPESPVYNAETIRKIQDTDPVRASTIVNPVISRLIENTHAVKKLADKAQQRLHLLLRRKNIAPSPSIMRGLTALAGESYTRLTRIFCRLSHGQKHIGQKLISPQSL